MSETILEPVTSQAQASPKPKRVPFFTKANARQFAIQGKAAQMQASKQAQEQALMPEQAEQATASPEPDPFHSRTLARVRVQVSRLLSLMVSEDDGPKLERLAGAIAKLEEIERRLSDRSLPAVRRVQDRPGSSSSRSAALLLSKPSAVPVQRQEQE